MPVTVIARADTGPVPNSLRFIDIGVNLTDPVFRGSYHGKKRHDDDMDAMLERARNSGVKSMLITGTSLRESQQALQLAQRLGVYCTIGCHPTRSAEFDKFGGGPEAYLSALDKLVASGLQGKGRAVAIGECGLDYDRLRFATPEVQQRHFRAQLSLAKKYHLPLFLHSRAAHADFVNILREEGFGEDGGKAVGGRGGMDMGFYLSVNGCSLKTEENLEVAKAIRPERVLLETDAPWCSMTGGHASKHHLSSLPPSLRALYFPPSTRPENFVHGKAVKGRNEPCATGGVAWVMHKLHDVPFETITEMAFKNTIDLFGLDAELKLN
ncbi:hypothetical protein GGX14DRAFT_640317 [Mycena pura]|uniref:Mg-dependent DNase n=1 Tax=Mycena pura TaxID=153505 RepID=A0AAD6YPL5_9AGAR|nr:hypothetical protein GGX14DRAFT_640317 [Mycena pura]